MFLALGITPTRQQLEPTEKIQVHLVPWEVVVNSALSGREVPGIGLPIMDCGSRLAILLADRFINTVLRRL